MTTSNGFIISSRSQGIILTDKSSFACTDEFQNICNFGTVRLLAFNSFQQILQQSGSLKYCLIRPMYCVNCVPVESTPTQSYRIKSTECCWITGNHGVGQYVL